MRIGFVAHYVPCADCSKTLTVNGYTHVGPERCPDCAERLARKHEREEQEAYWSFVRNESLREREEGGGDA